MAINWKDISKRYRGKWIALKEDEISIISVGDSAKEALSDALKNGYQKPIIAKVPVEVITYIGNGFFL